VSLETTHKTNLLKLSFTQRWNNNDLIEKQIRFFFSIIDEEKKEKKTTICGLVCKTIIVKSMSIFVLF